MSSRHHPQCAFLSFYENPYFEYYFLGITLWCYITSGRNGYTVSVCWNFYIQYFTLFCMHQIKGALINQPTEKRERGCVCQWPKRLLSQATNSQNSVWTRPTQARTRPDPQLTALFHAVLCCTGPRPRLTRVAQCQFLPFGVFSECQKTVQTTHTHTHTHTQRTEQTNKCSSDLCLLHLCERVRMSSTCLRLHTCTCTVCNHPWTCARVCVCVCVCVHVCCQPVYFVFPRVAKAWPALLCLWLTYSDILTLALTNLSPHVQAYQPNRWRKQAPANQSESREGAYKALHY